jgi:hypothetical protein
VDKRTEFPALEARKSELEHQHYEAKKQLGENYSVKSTDFAALQTWLVSIREELDELTYVLRIVGHTENRIDVTGHTLLIAMVVYAVIMLAVVALFVRYLGA